MNIMGKIAKQKKSAAAVVEPVDLAEQLRALAGTNEEALMSVDAYTDGDVTFDDAKQGIIDAVKAAAEKAEAAADEPAEEPEEPEPEEPKPAAPAMTDEEREIAELEALLAAKRKARAEKDAAKNAEILELVNEQFADEDDAMAAALADLAERRAAALKAAGYTAAPVKHKGPSGNGTGRAGSVKGLIADAIKASPKTKGELFDIVRAAKPGEYDTDERGATLAANVSWYLNKLGATSDGAGNGNTRYSLPS